MMTIDVSSLNTFILFSKLDRCHHYDYLIKKNFYPIEVA